MYKLFRILVAVCLIILFAISAAYFFDKLADKTYAIVSGVTALLAAFFSVFASRPIESHDMTSAVDQLLTTYDKETFGALKTAKEQELKIKEFIEVKSNELFLVKHRSYLEEEILNKYCGSDMEKMVGELIKVENKLNGLDVKYDEIDLPKRFKKLLQDLDVVKQKELMVELVDALPFLPFKKLLKLSVRISKK
jgi:hypothetical protein